MFETRKITNLIFGQWTLFTALQSAVVNILILLPYNPCWFLNLSWQSEVIEMLCYTLTRKVSYIMLQDFNTSYKVSPMQKVNIVQDLLAGVKAEMG